MPSIKSARVARGILLPAICTSAGALVKRNALTKLSVCSAILFLSAISFSTVHAQQKKFAVGTASASLGKKITGFLEVPAGVDPGTNIPTFERLYEWSLCAESNQDRFLLSSPACMGQSTRRLLPSNA